MQFLTTLLMLYDPIRKLNKVNLILQEAMAAGQRVSRLIDDPERHPGAARGAGGRRRCAQGIAYERVSFSYDDRPVLRDVSLAIRAGEIVAAGGPVGRRQVDAGQPRCRASSIPTRAG